MQPLIQRITNASELDIDLFNQLLDEGTTWDQAQAEIFLANADNALFVAVEHNQRPVGFLTAYRLQRLDKRRAEVLLYEIGVDEANRRQGVGSALLQAVKEWAHAVGADEVWVQTNKSNAAAVGLYASGGGHEDASDTTMYTFAIAQ